MILALMAVMEVFGFALVVAALVFAGTVLLFLPFRTSRERGERPAAAVRSPIHRRGAASVPLSTPPPHGKDVTDRAVPVASPPAPEVGLAEQLLPADRWYAVALAGLFSLVALEEGVHLAVGVLLVVGPPVALVIWAAAAVDRRRRR